MQTVARTARIGTVTPARCTGRAIASPVSQTAGSFRHGMHSRQTPRPVLGPGQNVGCSYWVYPRQNRSYSTKQPAGQSSSTHLSDQYDQASADASLVAGQEDIFDFMEEDEDFEDDYVEEDSFTVDQVTTEASGDGGPTPIDLSDRPKLPRSIKKLNKLLSRHVIHDIPEHELKESFVRGSGPGGQAINKTNSSVSLIHLPTGIRIQAQPTRMREQNRKAARHILREKLDNLRAAGLYTPSEPPKPSKLEGLDPESKEAQRLRKKAEQNALAAAYSKHELKAAKERSRKADRAKKHRKKKRKMEEEAAAAESGDRDVSDSSEKQE